jgi:hypothetical protein
LIKREVQIPIEAGHEIKNQTLPFSCLARFSFSNSSTRYDVDFTSKEIAFSPLFSTTRNISFESGIQIKEKNKYFITKAN